MMMRAITPFVVAIRGVDKLTSSQARSPSPAGILRMGSWLDTVALPDHQPPSPPRWVPFLRLCRWSSVDAGNFLEGVAP